jgi:Tfp pilus assembly protein PilX
VKTPASSRTTAAGNALVITMIMTAVALTLLAGVLSWSSGNARMTARSNQFTRSVAAAEAATEKVNTRIASDYLNSGEVQVIANLPSYRATVPTASDSGYWDDWLFSDAQGNPAATYVNLATESNYTVLTGAYAGLTGFASTYNIISNARESNNLQVVTAGVLEGIQLVRIPIFQFAMYSSGEMEVSCGQPFNVNGPVHSNGQLYVEPDNALTFDSGVTAVGNVVFSRDPLDPRGPPGGTVTYLQAGQPKSGQPALTLPIGTTNTPIAVRQIIEPPAGELASTALGRSRYYNQVDMVITVSNNGFRINTGIFNNFGTVLTNLAEIYTNFLSTNTTFEDWREGKTVYPVDLDMSIFTNWNATNHDICSALGRSVCSIYFYDVRTLPAGSLAAVRIKNGSHLPPLGMTIATMDPLYVWGHYNASGAMLGTNIVTGTLPASFAADAITVLSANWNDGNSTFPLGSRNALPTTINAAFLAGEVDTTPVAYSGGMENFPRFLESWTGKTFTYNGSMIRMFPSLYATNIWGSTNTYNPPPRNWSYDTNFNIPSLLPPLTPGLQVVQRSQWATLAPDSVTIPAP